MQDEFGEKGLSVIGITSEPSKLTDQFMEDTQGRYAYAYESSGKLMRALGGKGYPSAALINPAGTVVWTGHPGNLDSRTVSDYLEGAFKKPIWEWPKSTKALVKVLKKKQFAKSLEELDKLAGTDDSISEIRVAVDAMIVARMEALEAAYKEGDFLGASDLSDQLKSQMKGLDENYNRAIEVKALIKKSKDAKGVIKLQEKLLELRDERLNTRKDVTDLIEVVEKIAEKGEGTFAAKQAEEFIKELRKNLR